MHRLEQNGDGMVCEWCTSCKGMKTTNVRWMHPVVRTVVVETSCPPILALRPGFANRMGSCVRNG